MRPREGESREEFIARLVAAAPPLNEEQKALLRSIGRSYRVRKASRKENKGD